MGWAYSFDQFSVQKKKDSILILVKHVLKYLLLSVYGGFLYAVYSS